MKRVRVYKEIISDENLRLAIQEVNAGHRRNGNHSLNKKVIEIENNMDEYVEKLRAFIQGLVDGDEHMHPPLKRRRWDRNADSGKGKWRDINEPLLWPDQYVHHAVVQPMIPHIMRSMDRYCIASVPGRGNSYGVKALKKWMKNDVEGTKYCCECDIYHCFEELDPPYVIEALKRVFKDTETLWLCDAIMEYGVLIGAFFSAWFLHLTLQPLDLMIHQKQYGVSHYVRQMDNFTIFGSNKRKLRRLLEDMSREHIRLCRRKSNGTAVRAYHQLLDTDSDMVTRSCESTIYSGSSNRFIFTTTDETGTASSHSRGLRG